MSSEFVEWLKTKMDERGISQVGFARVGGLSPSTVSVILSGKSQPGEKFILATAKVLRVPVSVVLEKAGVEQTGNLERGKNREHLSQLIDLFTDDELYPIIKFTEGYLTRR